MLLKDILREEETEKPAGGDGTDKTKTPPIEDKKVEDDEEDEDEKAEREEGVKLLRALKDPKQGKRVLEILAREAGIKISDEDKKETKDAILEALEESLGADYKWLAPKFAPAIKKLLDQHASDLEGKLSQLSDKNIQDDTDRAVEELSGQYKDFKLHNKAIIRLMKDLSPSKGMSQKDYLTKLYKLAKAESGQTTDTDKEDRRKRAFGDISSRLSPLGGDDKSNNKLANQRPNRREAIAAAMNSMLDKVVDD